MQREYRDQKTDTKEWVFAVKWASLEWNVRIVQAGLYTVHSLIDMSEI